MELAVERGPGRFTSDLPVGADVWLHFAAELRFDGTEYYFENGADNGNTATEMKVTVTAIPAAPPSFF